MEILAFLSTDASGRHLVVFGIRTIMLKLAQSVKLKRIDCDEPDDAVRFQRRKGSNQCARRVTCDM